MYSQNPVFIPGPTNIPEPLRRASDIPTIDHRSPEFQEIIGPALHGVKEILKSRDAEIFLFPSTGTGGWEASITNMLSPNDKVLAGRYGMFSHRWIEMCRRYGLRVEEVRSSWRCGVPLEEYAARLKADVGHEIKAVLVTHNETATGVRSDIGAVRQILDSTRHPALLLVDGVSSVASIDFRMDEWKVDVAVTGSQKGFMLSPGLAIVALSPKAVEAVQFAKLPRAYFDMREMAKAYSANGFPYTPPVGLINGLGVSTKMLLEEGLENVFRRHHRIASGIRAAVNAWGLTLCAEREELYSDTVTAVQVPDGFDAGRVVSLAAEKYRVAFGAGLGDVAGKVFRIGHLGSMTEVMALSGIATAEMVLADLGYEMPLGTGVAAAQEVYRQSNTSAGKIAA
jgi:alanine-glyoxylate transaminase / serine-glyoxylate transaminase / serine-pyruvate transaminase